MTKTTEKPARILQPIPGTRIKLAQFQANDWMIQAPSEVTVEDMENPGLWTASRDIKRGDRVQVVQGLRYTELFCYDDAPGQLMLRVIHTIELPPQNDQSSKALPAGYAIRRATPDDNAVGNFIVEREKDGFLMIGQHHRLDTFEDARRALLDHNAVRQPKSNVKAVA